MNNDTRALYPRPCGLETEFGMMVRGGEAVAAGSLFVEKFRPEWLGVSDLEWDATDRIKQDPDARADHAGFDNPTWRRRSNFLLKNGGRFYLDGGHAEVSTPLCLGSLELVRWNRACYALIDGIRRKHKEVDGREFRIYRNNVASPEPQGSIYNKARSYRVSFACHEDYSSRRDIPLDVLIQRLGYGFFPARIPIIGAGKVGADCGMQTTDFQMSQRADFLVRTYAIATTHDRPIYNTRDVPYADPKRFRRIHVISGDSNMLPVPEFLKVALTDIALRMIEDGVLGRQFEFLDPTWVMKEISRDMTFTRKYAMAHGKYRRSILDILSEYRDCFGEYLAARWPSDACALRAVTLFSSIIERLSARDEGALYGTLDWVTKKCIIRNVLAKKGFDWKSYQAVQLDYEYANNDHENSLMTKLFPNVEQDFFTLEERHYAEEHPPDSRSRWIIEIIRRYRSSIHSSNYWHNLVANIPPGRDLGMFIFFPDPQMRYDEQLASEVFQLPFEGCIQTLLARGVLEVRNNEYGWHGGEQISDAFYSRHTEGVDQTP